MKRTAVTYSYIFKFTISSFQMVASCQEWWSMWCSVVKGPSKAKAKSRLRTLDDLVPKIPRCHSMQLQYDIYIYIRTKQCDNMCVNLGTNYTCFEFRPMPRFHLQFAPKWHKLSRASCVPWKLTPVFKLEDAMLQQLFLHALCFFFSQKGLWWAGAFALARS